MYHSKLCTDYNLATDFIVNCVGIRVYQQSTHAYSIGNCIKQKNGNFIIIESGNFFFHQLQKKKKNYQINNTLFVDKLINRLF